MTLMRVPLVFLCGCFKCSTVSLLSTGIKCLGYGFYGIFVLLRLSDITLSQTPSCTTSVDVDTQVSPNIYTLTLNCTATAVRTLNQEAINASIANALDVLQNDETNAENLVDVAKYDTNSAAGVVALKEIIVQVLDDANNQIMRVDIDAGNVVIPITLRSASTDISASESDHRGLSLTSVGVGKVEVRNTGTITTQGLRGHGVYSMGHGDVTATNEAGGRITIRGTNAYGVYSTGMGDVTATNAGMICTGFSDVGCTSGSNASGVHGVYALSSSGHGAVTATNSGMIRMHYSSSSSHGVYARNDSTGNTEGVKASNSGTILSIGRDSYSVYARNDINGVISTTDTIGVHAENTGSALSVFSENRGSNSRITTTGDGAHGLYAYSTEAVVTATNNGIINTGQSDVDPSTGRGSHGVYAKSEGSVDVTAMNRGTIITKYDAGINEEDGAYGLFAQSSGIESSARVIAENTGSGASIITHSHYGYGVYVYSEGIGRVQAGNIRTFFDTDTVSIETSGNHAHGLYAKSVGHGDVTVKNIGGQITTRGNNGHGLYARSDGGGLVEAINTAIACTNGDGDSRACVQITGTGAHGVFAHNTGGVIRAMSSVAARASNSGTVTVALDSYGVYALNQGVVLTVGSSIHGVWAENTNENSDTSVRAENQGEGARITTNDDDAYGVFAETAGNGEVSAGNSGMINTQGDNAYGVYVRNTRATSITGVTATNSGTICTGGTINNGSCDRGRITTGMKAYGVYARTSGRGVVQASNTAAITTHHSRRAHGVFALNVGGNDIAPNTGGVKASNSGPITVAQGSYGVYGRNRGVIATTDSTHGVLAENINTDSDTSVRAENGNSGMITTASDQVHGVYAKTSGTGSVRAHNASSVTARGMGAHGVFAHNTGGMDMAPNTGGARASSSGTVTVASGSYGVYALNEGVIGRTGTDNHGVWAENTNENSDTSIRAENQGEGARITTNDDDAYGVFAETAGNGEVSAGNSGMINTQGDNAYGVYVRNTRATSITGVTATNSGTICTGGTINNGSCDRGRITTGMKAYGVYARTSGRGVVQASNTAAITTHHSRRAHGVFALNVGGNDIAPNTGGVKASNSGTITVAQGSYGVYGRNRGVIATTDSTHGVLAENINTDSDTSVRAENGNSGTITTASDQVHGVYAKTSGTGSVRAHNTSSVTARGMGAHGVFAHNTGGTDMAPNTGGARASSSGTVTVASGSYGVYVYGLNQRVISSTGSTSSGTIEVTGTHAYGVYGLNEGAISTTDIHGLWAENTNENDDTSVRAENRDSGTITTAGSQAHGVYARTDGTGRVEAINTAIACTNKDGNPRGCVQITATGAHGVFASNTGGTMSSPNTGGVTAENLGTITITDIDTYELYALNKGVIEISRNSDRGLAGVHAVNGYLFDSNQGSDTAVRVENKRRLEMGDLIPDSGTIITHNMRGYGLYAVNWYLGNPESSTERKATQAINQEQATIETSGENAIGILVTSRSGGVILGENKGTITTSGNIAYGILVRTDSSGTASAENQGSGRIDTTGTGAHGLYALSLGSSGTGALEAKNKGKICTGGTWDEMATICTPSGDVNSGKKAHGVFAFNGGGTLSSPNAGGVTAKNSGTIVIKDTTHSYGVYGLNAGVIEVTNKHGVHAENTNRESDTSVRGENENDNSFVIVHITANDTQAHGVYVYTRGLGVAEAINSGEIEVTITTGLTGTQAYGVYAKSTGTGHVLAKNHQAGYITMLATGAHGVFAHNTGGTSDAPNTGGVRAFSSGIVIVASSSYGVYGLNEGVIATIDIHGVWAENTNTQSNTEVRAESQGSTARITTSGNHAYGVHAESLGKGLIAALNSGIVCTGGTISGENCERGTLTTGHSAHGIYAQAKGAATGDVIATNQGIVKILYQTTNTTMTIEELKAVAAYGVFAENTHANNAATVKAEHIKPDVGTSLITTSSDHGYGVYARTAGIGRVEAIHAASGCMEDMNEVACLITRGTGAHGVFAHNTGGIDIAPNTGGVHAENRGGIIEVASGSYGVYALNQGVIKREGHDKLGVYALQSSIDEDDVSHSLSVRAENTGTIEIQGTSSSTNAAVFASLSSMGEGIAINSGTILTGVEGSSTSNSFFGVMAQVKQSISATAMAINEGEGQITTYGQGSYGMYVLGPTNSISGFQATNRDNGQITTYGQEAYGILVFSRGSGSAITENHGQITTTGLQAYGMYSESSSTGPVTTTNKGGMIMTKGPRAHGILAFSQISGDAVAKNEENGQIIIEGNQAQAVYAWSHGSVTAKNSGIICTGSYWNNDAMECSRIRADNTMITTGISSPGIWARAEGIALASATNETAGKITTYGYRAYGVFASNSHTGDVMSTNAGQITTSGQQGYGVYAYSLDTGTGKAFAMNTRIGVITTYGQEAHGIYARNTGMSPNTKGLIASNSGTLDVRGNGSYGVYALNQGVINLPDPDPTSENTDEPVYGVYAENTNSNSNTAVKVENGGISARITTSDEGAHGLYATSMGTGAVIAENAGQITTTAAHGMYIKSGSTSGDVRIINSGTVTTQGTQAHAILVENQGGTTGSEWDTEFATDGTEADFAVYITNSGTLTAQGTNALAMKTTDLNDRVENTGTITAGNVELGDGADLFINHEGTIAASVTINMGDGVDTLRLLGGSILGSFHGGDGKDILEYNMDTIDLMNITYSSFELTQTFTQRDKRNQRTSQQTYLTSRENTSVMFQVIKRSPCARLSGNNERICTMLFDALPEGGNTEDLSHEELKVKDAVVEVHTDYLARGQGESRFQAMNGEWSLGVMDTSLLLTQEHSRFIQQHVFNRLFFHQTHNARHRWSIWGMGLYEGLEDKKPYLPYGNQTVAGFVGVDFERAALPYDNQTQTDLVGMDFYQQGGERGMLGYSIGMVLGSTSMNIGYEDVPYREEVTSQVYGGYVMMYEDRVWSITLGGGYGQMHTESKRGGGVSYDGEYGYIYGQGMMNLALAKEQGFWLTPGVNVQYSTVSQENFEMVDHDIGLIEIRNGRKNILTGEVDLRLWQELRESEERMYPYVRIGYRYTAELGSCDIEQFFHLIDEKVAIQGCSLQGSHMIVGGGLQGRIKEQTRVGFDYTAQVSSSSFIEHRIGGYLRLDF